MLHTSDELAIRVRYNECDPMGVAHHTAYPIWFEMGRTELCRVGGFTYRDLEAMGTFLAVTKLDVRYRAPARYDDLLTLETSIARVTRVKIEHAYRLVRAGILLATGSSTVACLDADGRPAALPSALRDETP